ncbi:MAG: recombinase family protein [Pseudomonadota bacterium]
MVEEEAEVVRDIFGIYEACGNLRSAKKLIDAKGIKTAVRYRANGSSKSGLPFSLGHIHQMLTNPIYAGRIRHKKEVHPGQHPAIIDPDDWDALQAKLADGASIKRGQGTQSRKPRSLLIGRIFDETGDRLTPSHSKTSSGKRLRYYVSRRLIVGHKENEVGGWRLPAPNLEDRVSGLISAWLTKPQNRFAAVPQASPEQVVAMDDLVTSLKRSSKRSLKLAKRIDLSPGQLIIQLCAKQVAKLFSVKPEQINSEELVIKAEFQLRKRGVESKIILAGETNPRDEVLWANITRAHRYFDMIKSGRTYAEIAEAEGTSSDRIQKLADLALLAPDIVRDVLQGTQPIGLTTEWLIRHSIPASWQEQRDLISKL